MNLNKTWLGLAQPFLTAFGLTLGYVFLGLLSDSHFTASTQVARVRNRERGQEEEQIKILRCSTVPFAACIC